MDHNAGQNSLSESVEELREKLEAVKRMIDSDEVNEEQIRNRRKEPSYRASIIDGNFLSIIFMIVLILIVVVSVYAFFNLFTAVRKKYETHDSEL